MKKKLLSALAILSTVTASAVMADGDSVPTSKWGAEDQAGASNYMTPEKAMEAIALMKSGTVVSIGRVYQAEMPLFGTRAFALRGTSGLAGGPLGGNKVVLLLFSFRFSSYHRRQQQQPGS